MLRQLELFPKKVYCFDTSSIINLMPPWKRDIYRRDVFPTLWEKLEKIPIQISSLATADKEVLAFIFAYLLPLIDINHKMLAFVLVLFAFVIFTTHIYHFNPIFGLFGYHFYEVTTTNGISYVLMSKKQIRNLNQVTEVILVSDYVLIDTKNK